MPRAAPSLALSVFLALSLGRPQPSAAQDPPTSPGRLFGSDTTPPPGAHASGQVVVMRLSYAAPEGCPIEQTFRDAVTAHVRGWDPFAPNAPWRFSVTVTRRSVGYEAAAELRDVTGAVTWTRSFAPTPKCADLLEDLAVALSLHVDPPQGPRPSSAPLPLAPVPLAPQPIDQAPAPPPDPTLLGLRIGAAAWGDLATAPRPAFAVTVDAGYRVGPFSISAEFRADPPAGAVMTGGATLTVNRLAGAVVPCGHLGERVAFVGCLVGELGRVEGNVGVLNLMGPATQSGLAAAAGVRVGIEVGLARHLSARAAVDLKTALARPEFRLGSSTTSPLPLLWESPGFLGGLGLGLVALF